MQFLDFDVSNTDQMQREIEAYLGYQMDRNILSFRRDT